MRKGMALLAVVAAMLLGLSGVANAYPPAAPAVEVSAASGPPGFILTVTVACSPGETVDVVLDAESASATCVASTPSAVGFRTSAMGALRGADQDATGTVSIDIATPTTPGTYTGTVTGTTSGLIGTFTVVVEGSTAETTDGSTSAALPSTGSDGTNSMVMIAGGLIVVGLGVLAVASIRRRQQPVGV